MIFALWFALLAAGCVALAATHGGWAWALLWPAVAFVTVGGAYLFQAPAVFGKSPRGRLAWPARLMLWPYLGLLGALWWLARWLDRGRPWDAVGAALIVGRRPTAAELPDGVTCVVDLTCELAVAPGVAEGRVYHCLPTLDGCAPSLPATLALLDALAADPPARSYVHCAQGRGRTGTFAAALLLHRGQAATPDEALAMLRRCRPGIRLGRTQRRFLGDLAAALAGRAAAQGIDAA